MLRKLENETYDGDGERTGERQNSTRSCPGSIPVSITRRAQFPRRSLKELRIDVGKNLKPFVHRGKVDGLERITEDQLSPASEDDKPTAPARMLRARMKIDDAITNVDDVQQRRTTCMSETCSDPPASERSVVERIDETFHTHYYTIAYTLVIVAYLVGFVEYLYFRLVSIVIPERVAFHPSCQKKEDRRIGKDGFHYGVSIGAFIAIAFFQLIIVKMQYDLADHIRKTISRSMYRTFLCYGICSFINCGIIFYMVAIQDSLGDTVSTVLMYTFDGVVILYFIAFPLTTVIYHPHVHCFQNYSRRTAPLPASLLLGIRSQTSTLESNLSQEAPPPSTINQLPPPTEISSNLPPLEPIQYDESPRRPNRTSTLV
ncbi:hypothetical protein DICVIV_04150 [Dictyocaulus viviparus]|uniref:Uncharacterized protein n=1 Tax=Dictyocaulus viviparus TaxID=29172 RepID=A0A0D8Y123_DICVI|nr:hypothetical protein DICVIV_04150 [Dictyocaulus viviparus]